MRKWRPDNNTHMPTMSLKKILPLLLSAPEVVFLPVLAGIGGLAAGWLLVGAGALLALLPLLGWASCRFLLRRRG